MTPLPTLGNAGFFSPSDPEGVLSQVISSFIWLVFIIGGITMFILFIMGGFAIMSSGGDQQKLQDGRSKITWAIIGFIVLLASWGIIMLIESMVGMCLGFTCGINVRDIAPA